MEESRNIIYLSRCAFTTAEWLHEAHTAKLHVAYARTICTAVQMLTCEADPRLYEPTEVNATVLWIHESVWHYEWMLRHYECLANKYARMHNRNYVAHHKLIACLRTYMKVFPDVEWQDPPLCMPDKYKQTNTEQAYRDYYIAENIVGRCYNKIPPPFWVPMSIVLAARAMEPDVSTKEEDWKDSPESSS